MRAPRRYSAWVARSLWRATSPVLICHLGNIALELQAKLSWDPDAERFEGSNASEANRRLDREQRTSWAG